jgi:radical SAM superfamily enzyme
MTGRPSSQELADLALQGYECPNADAPMHTSAGCTWCSGSAPYREATAALAARLQDAERVIRSEHAAKAAIGGGPCCCEWCRALEGAAE